MTGPLTPGAGLPPPPTEDVPFTYVAEFLNAAPNTVTAFDIAIEADSDFYVEAITGIASVGNPPSDTSATPFVPALVRFKSSASGSDWSDRAVPWTSYFGRGDAKDFYPFAYRKPRKLPRNSNVRVEITNLDTTNAIRARIALHGYKRYV
jgi:hypothetical protein